MSAARALDALFHALDSLSARDDTHDARMAISEAIKELEFRRICCACHRDMGPAGPGFTGDTHGLCEPPCPEGRALGYSDT